MARLDFPASVGGRAKVLGAFYALPRAVRRRAEQPVRSQGCLLTFEQARIALQHKVGWGRPVFYRRMCVPWDCGSSSGRRLANEAMDLSDRLFRLAPLGRIEASCRGDLAHGCLLYTSPSPRDRT